jgi:hypothetical protein
VRRRPVRAHRAGTSRRVLPLHPLPATHRDGRVGPRIDGRTFRILQGAELVKEWRPPDGGFEKCFCGDCGAHLFSRNPADRTQMSVRLGEQQGDLLEQLRQLR